MSANPKVCKERNYDEISLRIILALPSEAEARALSERELGLLRNLSNMLDNIAYLELKRRQEAAALDLQARAGQ